MEADVARQVDRRAVPLGVREALLLAGEVHRDQAVRDAVLDHVQHEREVRLRRVRAHERRDQPDLDAAHRRAAPCAPRQTASTTSRPVSPLFVWSSGAQRISA